jgi:citrate lyase beta subunit
VILYQQAISEKTGAIVLENQMIDMASVRLAQAMLQVSEEKEEEKANHA